MFVPRYFIIFSKKDIQVCYNENMFVHLHTHTEYSLLDGSNKIKDYVARVKSLGMNAAAITDHGNMFGVINFYREANKNGIKPVLGCEVYVAPNSRFDKELTGGEDRYYHLILLAENNMGYYNLMKIVSAGYVEGFYYRPRVDMEILNRYHEGIICLSACLAGEVQRYISKGLYDEAKKTALKYRDCFGVGNYYLELQDHGIPEQKTVNQALMRMSRELNIPLVATNDIHYTNKEDAEAHDLLLCIQTGKKVDDEDRMRYEGGQFYVKTEDEMRALFPYALEALENTQKIADRCNVTIEFGNYKLPEFDVPEGYTSRTYIEKLCEDGLKKKFPKVFNNDDSDVCVNNTNDAEKSGNKAAENTVSEKNALLTLEALRNRIKYELEIIDNLGFVNYFLIVSDFIRYAKNNGISVGPGRGSAAGSLVSYCLDIIDINPIEYDLYFERFLNPYRTSMPDIDTDFSPEGRYKVIDYVVEKYGRDHVCQIITFGTLAAKGVLKDVVRVLDKPIELGNKLSKLVPFDPKITLDGALAQNPEFMALYETDDEVKYIVDMGRKLEGLPRQSSIHAAGVLISPKPVDEFIPLAQSKDGAVTTQFEAPILEELGLLKMDFLGLRNLTILDNAIENVYRNRDEKVNISTIDFKDAGVYQMIGRGETEGVFQLESPGMTNFMMRLKPANLDDIIAGIALYRPGTMPFIDTYINVRNNPDSVTYMCPQLEPILKATSGCIIYQEQAMRIVQDLAGFPMGLADEFRRAISKKKEKVMLENRERFIHGGTAHLVSGGGKEETVEIPGCVKNGISEEIANAIYDQIVEFSKYAFNKSHAAAYAHVTYQTAYMRYHYPVEYMAALITSVVSNTKKIPGYISAVRAMGIEILPPNINEGIAGFSASGNKIIFGLASIKSVGWAVIDEIVRERESRGLFLDLEDFVNRLSSKEVNKRTVEALIKSGAFDCFGNTRKQLMAVYDQIIDNSAKQKKDSMTGQMSLFDFAPEEERQSYKIKMPDIGEFDKETKLKFEKEMLGVYVSGHPLDEYADILRKKTTHLSTDFYISDEEEEEGNIGLGAMSSVSGGMSADFDSQQEESLKDGDRVVIGGIIETLEKKFSKKNGDSYAVATVEDLAGTVECMIWHKTYEEVKGWLQENEKVIIEGRAKIEDDRDGKVFCNKITRFTGKSRKLCIQFESLEEFTDMEGLLRSMLRSSKGDDSVFVYIKANGTSGRMSKQLEGVLTNADEILVNTLKKEFGDGNVVVMSNN